MRSIRDLELDGRTVFMRLDLNVPIKEGRITSDARIQAALPTVKHAIEAGAKLAVASHLGRPKGKRLPEASLEPVGQRLSELLQSEVIFADDCIGDGVKKLMQDLRPGKIILLENLRYHEGETKNQSDFVRALAAPFQVYVNDAFGSSHRAHASIVGIIEYCKDAAAGFLLEKEVEALKRLLNNPDKPFVAVVGGAKVADKVGVLNALVSKVDSILIGGAMAYTFLKAQGKQIGCSRCEANKISIAKDILERAKVREVNICLPQDHVAASAFSEDTDAKLVTGPDLSSDLMGLDIGQKTREQYAHIIQSAKSLFWNGPMGVFEWKQFSAGTFAVAQAVADCAGYTVIGGGDSVAAIEVAGVKNKIDHVSTGGGASLELMENGTLPGIEAILKKNA